MSRARWTMADLFDGFAPPGGGLVPALAGSAGAPASARERRVSLSSTALVLMAAVAILVGGLAVPVAQLLPRLASSGTSGETLHLPSTEMPAGLNAAIAAAHAPTAYHLTATADGWAAANPAHGFGTSFTSHGVDVTAASGGAALGLEVARIGRGADLARGSAAHLAADGAHIEYRRGGVTEWYVNDLRGLEQGISLAARPAGDPSTPLVVELGATDGFRPELSADAQSVTFTGADSTFTYGGLDAVDANGADVPAHLGVADGHVSLTVADAGAVYPITIDPIVATQEATLTQFQPQAGARYGASVAVYGDLAVVGSPGEADATGTPGIGLVEVFRQASPGVWAAFGVLQGPANRRGFGTSVAVTGHAGVFDTLAVGSPGDSATPGQVELFTFAPGLTRDIILNGATPSDGFGTSVALSGDTLVVGAPDARKNDNTSFDQVGAAYVYQRTGTTWSTTPTRLHANVEVGLDSFGQSVAISEDASSIAVGVPGDSSQALLPGGDYNSVPHEGSAYVFARNGASWTTQGDHLTGTDTTDGDGFGASVAISGDRLVVGAPQGLHGPGKGYVFARSGTTWSQEDRIQPPVPGTDFGSAVAISGDTVLVGDPAINNTHVFSRVGTSWVHQDELFATGGTAVALDGDVAVLGAPNDTADGVAGAGQARVFRLVGGHPSVVVHAEAANVKTFDSIWDVVFSTPVTGFDVNDLLLDGSTSGTAELLADGDGDASTYRVHVFDVIQEGTVRVRIPAGAATDSAGLPNDASTSTDNVTNFDRTEPSATVALASGQTTPSSAATLHFTVSLSEDVITQADGTIPVIVASNTGNLTTVVTPHTPGSKRLFDVAISGMTQNGAVALRVGGRTLVDAAGNQNSQDSNTASVSWVDDNTAPEVVLNDTPAIEGVAKTLSGVVRDAEGDASVTWTATPASVTDSGASCSFSDAHAIAPTVTCNNDGIWTLKVTADDHVNPVASGTASIVVINASPVLGTLTGPASVATGVPFQVSAPATDLGPRDVLTCTVDWGDSTSTGTISAGVCTAQHTYTTTGGHEVTMSLVDDSGASDHTDVLRISAATRTQTIQFDQPTTPLTYGAPAFTVSATTDATPPLPVSFAVSGPCTIAGATVTITGAGVCHITASQPGNTTYSAAPDVTRDVTINRATLTITAPDATIVYGALPPALTPSITGFVNGDDRSDLSDLPVCRLDTFDHFAVGVHAGGITCDGGFTANYVPTFVDGTLTVTKAALTVTAPDSSMEFGDNSVRPAPLYSGFQYDDQPSRLDNKPTCIGGDFRTAAGFYPGGVTCGDGAADNYDITYVTGDLTVTKAPLDVKASDATTTYGTAATVTPIYSGFKNSDNLISIDVRPTCSGGPATTPVGSYTGATSCSGGSDANYELTYRTGNLTVTKARLTVTAPDANMTYGGSVPAVNPTYAGFVNGDEASDLTSVPTCTGGSPTTTAGLHTDALTCSGGSSASYTFSYVDGDLTVAKAPLTITASSSGMAYGSTSTPSVTPTYSGFVNGQGQSVLTPQATCSSIASPTLAVGTYVHGTSCSGAGTTNYAITYVEGTFTVRRVTLTVTPSSATMVYGSTPPAIAPSYSGFLPGDDASDLDTAPTCQGLPGLGVGANPQGSSCSGGADGNYDFQFLPGTVTVTPATLTVTAPNASMPYGSIGVQVEPQYSGFVNGDTADVVAAPLCLGGDPSMLPGLHPGAIVCMDGSAANYDLTYVNGDLTVEKAVLTIEPFDVERTYGATQTVVPSYSGLIPGDVPADILATAPTCTSAAGPTASVGRYDGAVTCSGAVAADPGRYSIRYLPGDVIVTKAALTIRASDATMHYGTAGATVTPIYSGFVNNQGPTVLTTAPTCSGGSPATSPGTHPGGTTCSGATAANYEISYVAGTLTVDKAPLTITAADATMTYGGAAPAVAPLYSGFLDDDTPSVLLALPTCASGGSPTTSAGVHAGSTTCSGAQSTDKYQITYVAGTLTVTQAPLTITASAGAMTYGGTPPAITPTYSGFVNGQGPAALSVLPTCVGGTPTTPAGTVAGGTSCSGATAANYEISYVKGALTVTKAPLTITASNASKVYGSAGATVTPSYAGFKNGQDPSALTTAPTCSGGTAATAVGSYPGATTCSGAAAANYEISYVKGALTVTPAPLKITASNGTMTYGDTPPTITPAYSGFVNGDNATALTTAPTCSGGTPTTPVGTYTASTTCTGAVAANYTVTYVAGTLTVTQAPLIVTADDLTRSYGAANPALTYRFTGLVNGEDASVVTGAPVLSTTATATSNVGTYPIKLAKGTLAAANYTLTTANGTLTVTKATTVLVANPTLLRILPLQLYVGTVSAKLTYGPGGTPAAGQTIAFSAGSKPICTAVTGADGAASCNVALPEALAAIANLGYTATFAGSPNLTNVAANGPLLSVS